MPQETFHEYIGSYFVRNEEKGQFKSAQVYSDRQWFSRVSSGHGLSDKPATCGPLTAGARK